MVQFKLSSKTMEILFARTPICSIGIFGHIFNNHRLFKISMHHLFMCQFPFHCLHKSINRSQWNVRIQKKEFLSWKIYSGCWNYRRRFRNWSLVGRKPKPNRLFLPVELRASRASTTKRYLQLFFTGARNQILCVPEKNPSTSSCVSSKILNEIDLLQVRLSNVIASTGAVVVNRRRIGKITDNYHEPIGRGKFGQVFKGTWHGCQVAVKEIRSPWRCSTVVEARSFAKMIQREIEALSAVQHRNIIGLLGLCMDNESSDGEASIRVSLIFEFTNGGTLFD
ncbi:uncharacterized protein LOC124206200 [Daphnia pulex]|uniref:uncharacterized protein LOC124206200 n=1 Tax=Daphnia pulex TaxID=6669 RepID=UPI001EE0A088|nr:uncharacterized protein LOC124206200 [Daphnia pulex]